MCLCVYHTGGGVHVCVSVCVHRICVYVCCKLSFVKVFILKVSHIFNLHEKDASLCNDCHQAYWFAS